VADFDLPKQAIRLIEEVRELEARAAAARASIAKDLDELEQIDGSKRNEVGGRERNLDLRAEALDATERSLDEKREAADNYRKQVESEAARDKAVADALMSDSLSGFALIGDAWADYQQALAEAEAVELETKTRPAMTAAEKLRDKGRRLAEATRRAKAAEWTVALYEHHLPWITELRDQAEQAAYVEAAESAEDGKSRSVDPAARWLTKEEFAGLSEAERNQRALDRYLKSRKSPWQLGRDYERYVGYLREQAGFAVTYQGIEKGFEDLGRDVLAERDGLIEVIQCKRWAQAKTIHEKHVFQLYGTVVLARLENPDKEVSGTFTTTTELSPKARLVAKYLRIKIEERFPLSDYPRIKCNIGRRGGERIYHLPFDQQYDTTVIEPERDELYVVTVAEAEARGFRRAWRWRGK
jgi:Restriction endonuclease